jgi:excisionase family DNA binding protein
MREPAKQKQQFTAEQILALRRNPPHVLSEREVAWYLGISERNARVLRQRRMIPHVRLGGRILYRLAEVNKALERLEIRAV